MNKSINQSAKGNFYNRIIVMSAIADLINLCAGKYSFIFKIEDTNS